uniref:MaoC family dehydratase n=1 Tax=Desulfatirhabdium butyrativorans TaxID=340467 RepID=A0A7C4MN23_9BACT
MLGKTIQEIQVNDSASFSKTITEGDIYQYAGVTGDFNPAHVNEVFARQTLFKTRIAHGMLSAGLISTVLGMYLPGPGTIYLEQHLSFKAPVRIGDTVTATARVISVDTAKNRIRLETVCTNQDGTVVLSGEALVMPPKGGRGQQ